ncbi:hypothetical protein [Streptomyces phaeochromogenes]|uniref:hypothetical protein n=1 Tax=Streptomyces phaeochromogenes TaxID=1923 RepID=UPI00340D7D85
MAGLVAGYAGYTVLAVAGPVVIVASSATLLTAPTVLGDAYLTWLDRGVLARPATLSASTEVTAGSHRQVMLQARSAAARAVTRASGAMMIATGGFLLVERLAG